MSQYCKTTASRRQEDADCSPKIHLFRRHDFCSCRCKSLEQFAVRLTKSRLIILLVQAVADIFIWTARPRRTANYSLLTAPFTNILSNTLLTCCDYSETIRHSAIAVAQFCSAIPMLLYFEWDSRSLVLWFKSILQVLNKLYFPFSIYFPCNAEDEERKKLRREHELKTSWNGELIAEACRHAVGE